MQAARLHFMDASHTAPCRLCGSWPDKHWTSTAVPDSLAGCADRLHASRTHGGGWRAQGTAHKEAASDWQDMPPAAHWTLSAQK